MYPGSFPYLQFMWVSPPLEARIRKKLARGGVPSIVAAVFLGVIVLLLDGDLMIAKLFLGIGTLCLLAAGSYLPAGRRSLSAGYLNLTIAAQVRRPLLALSIIEAVLMGVAYLPLVIHATEPTDVSTASLVIAMLMPVFMLGLVVMNYLVVRRLLPPGPETLHKYGLSGQIVGPPVQPDSPPSPPQASGPPQA
ncbi:hypothetical protein SAMN04487904_102356 [Actinopolyspora lacussalsi subsp. righensis]|uniref:Uncharacterized protein n=1 Tax=Actinopolyspora righensis TaxID=995060 RepID=A0A1I6YAS1_9ACTN|nr:hypothetical protein [Actinopolyspora righensis]SFT47512.1 hypothetical protein SAMN04487904_102356 [Actinopolyspora righensis]